MAEGRAAPDPNHNNAQLLSSGGKVDQQALFNLYARSDEEGDDDKQYAVRFVLTRDLEIPRMGR